MFDLRTFNGYDEIISSLEKGVNTAAYGITSGDFAFVSAHLERFACIVTNDFVSARNLLRQLNAYSGDISTDIDSAAKEFVYLPHKDEVLLYKRTAANATHLARNYALGKIASGKAKGCVVCVDALMQLLPNASEFLQNCLHLATGDVISPDSLAAILVKGGYNRTITISAEGEFAIRGGIVDIFLPSTGAVRLDFFDDILESIKSIDTETYKSLASLSDIEIFPVAEQFANNEQIKNYASMLLRSASKQKLGVEARTRLDTIVGEISMVAETNSSVCSYLLPFTPYSLLADYLPKESVVVWEEPKRLADKMYRLQEEHQKRVGYLLEKGEILPEHDKQLLSFDQTVASLKNTLQLSLQSIAVSNNILAPQQIVKLKSSQLINYRINPSQLGVDVNNWLVGGYRVMLFAGDEQRAANLQNSLSDSGNLFVRYALAAECKKSGIIASASILSGWINHDNKLVVIGCEDLFAKTTQQLKKSSKQVFLAPNVGDFVVHEVHGVGRCEGITSLTTKSGTKDYIVVKYRNEDTLYVPVEASNLLSRYSGGSASPKLNKLGGQEFEGVKKRAKANIKAMAIDLVKLYSSRSGKRGFCYENDNYLNEEFAKAFQFVETADQLKCIEEINVDLTSPRIMDRLLCGDVGFGKTEVALRAAFRVVSCGHQVAMLAPTTILAEQHYNTLVKRMQPFDIRVACLNRFRSTAEIKLILQSLANGEIDIVVGTHRLLSADVRFAKLGLLVLDEEQRFGVEDKEKIKVLKNNVDVLSMSATPIPRTLHMSLSGIRDISVIQTPPKERLPIESFVVEDSEPLLRDIILREVDRGGQVFVVYNRVESIDSFAARLKKLLPQQRFVVAHGQMDEKSLEKNIYSFSKGDYDVLVCSTIIENGIDIPNANTLIIYDADKLGLGQLYQLRGRVGRSDRLAFAYFVYRENKVLSEVAYKRLNSIMEHTDLGSGFKIAMKDLEIRGAGNVLGREQHGHIDKIGYDLYTRILRECLNEITGVVKDKAFQTSIEVDIDAFIPQNYIQDSKQRMTLYQRLATFSTQFDKAKILQELKEIYGFVPREVVNLVEIAHIKYLAQQAYVCEVVVSKEKIELALLNKEQLQKESLYAALSKLGNKAKLNVNNKLVVCLKLSAINVEGLLEQVGQFLSEIAQPNQLLHKN